ncbi:MAG: sulfotransferase family protein, partial [Promethearchaeota archaeon]
MSLKYADFAQIGPNFGCSFRNLMKLLISNESIALKHYFRILFMYSVSIVGIPFRFFEHMCYHKAIKRTTLKFPPIFIIGHWRSGTTHLHNLLTQDPQFGFITMLQASFPKSFMSNTFFSFWMNQFLPETRPMDNMKMGIFKPQEDEMALGNLFPYSFYNALYFPKRMMEYYSKYVQFKNVSPRLTKKWKYSYDYLLKTATLNMRGKQLVLKNPVNTARIKILLEMYPEAKFIHIYRNPYIIYLSTRHFYRKALEAFMFQNVSNELIEDNIIKIYKKMMISYFKEKKLIPGNNLIDIKFEDLESDTIRQLKRIYNKLNLQGFNKSKKRFVNYLEQIKSY